MNPLHSLDLGKKLGPLPRGVWLIGIGGGVGVAVLMRSRNKTAAVTTPAPAGALLPGDTGFAGPLGGSAASDPTLGGGSTGFLQPGFDPVQFGTLIDALNGIPGAINTQTAPGPAAADLTGTTFPSTPPADPGSALTSPTVVNSAKRTPAVIAKMMTPAHKRAVNARMAAEKKAHGTTAAKKKSATTHKAVTTKQGGAPPKHVTHTTKPSQHKPASVHHSTAAVTHTSHITSKPPVKLHAPAKTHVVKPKPKPVERKQKAAKVVVHANPKPRAVVRTPTPKHR